MLLFAPARGWVCKRLLELREVVHLPRAERMYNIPELARGIFGALPPQPDILLYSRNRQADYRTCTGPLFFFCSFLIQKAAEVQRWARPTAQRLLYFAADGQPPEAGLAFAENSLLGPVGTSNEERTLHPNQ